MNEQVQPSAMRRKAGAGRPPPEIGQITPAKALRTAVAQAAEDVVGLVAMPGAIEEARVTLEAIADSLPEHPLLALVEGPGGGFGLVVLDGQAVAALIEMQTTGRVVPRPAEARAPTRTDAIMCADFIDRLLETFEQRVGEAGLALAPALTGYRYAMALAEPRAVTMTLEDAAYRRFAFTVDFGRGGKTGALQIILPHDAPGQGPRAAGDAGAFTQALQAQVMTAQAVLTATLARRRMTLAEVTALSVGSEIALPAEALTEVALEDLKGRTVARGRLGQASGQRALRLAAIPATTPGAGARHPPPAALPEPAEIPALAAPGDFDLAIPDGAPEPEALAAFGVDIPPA
jgi:flagellar motor switch protein FliM